MDKKEEKKLVLNKYFLSDRVGDSVGSRFPGMYLLEKQAILNI